MGGGSWSSNAYDSAAADRAARGVDAFAYSDSTIRSGAYKVHDTLDPKSVNKNGPHTGLNVRESMDGPDHPNSQAVAVLFDVTGSMGTIPRELQKKLPELFGLLLRKGYVEDPQVLFGAIGDATCDRLPLQVGQFESDNRIDEALGNIVIESGGGGHITESYELAMYFMARHTWIDCYEKRGKKGYLFIIGDETPYARVDHRQVADHVGDTLEASIPTEDVVRELLEKWEVFYFLPMHGASHSGRDAILEPWRRLLGQNVIQLEDPDAVCEAIAMAIGVNEGVDLDTAAGDLVAVGASASTVSTVTAALAPLAAGRSSLASITGDLPTGGGASGSKRL